MGEGISLPQLKSQGKQATALGRQRSTTERIRIADLVISQFLETPATFWSISPELAGAIETYLQSSTHRHRRTPAFDGYMTDREREFKLDALTELLRQHQDGAKLDAAEATKALSLAAALRQHAQPFKEPLLEIATTALGLRLTSDKPDKVSITKGKSEHHTYELVRGVTLSLSWDGALIAIRFDPVEYRQRQKALSFVGAGTDSRRDVAENHDAYLWTTIDER